MTPDPQDKRLHERFDTTVQVHFTLPYDFRTEVDFTLEGERSLHPLPKHIGFSRNISVKGLCFESDQKIEPGQSLWLELHLPHDQNVIYMQAESRWSDLISPPEADRKTFLTGAEVKVVDGEQVDATVYFDEKYHVMWSQLLERVLGGFAKACKKRSPEKS